MQSLSAFNMQKRPGQAYAKILFAAWMLILGCVIPISIIHTNNNLPDWSIAVLELLGLGGLSLLLTGLILKIKPPLRLYGITAALAAPIALHGFNFSNYALGVPVVIAVIFPMVPAGIWLIAGVHRLFNR